MAHWKLSRDWCGACYYSLCVEFVGGCFGPMWSTICTSINQQCAGIECGSNDGATKVKNRIEGSGLGATERNMRGWAALTKQSDSVAIEISLVYVIGPAFNGIELRHHIRISGNWARDTNCFQFSTEISCLKLSFCLQIQWNAGATPCLHEAKSLNYSQKPERSRSFLWCRR